MGYGTYLKDLLRPMGVYRLDGTVNGEELECMGAALDGAAGQMEMLEREMSLATAQSWGLDVVEELLPFKPVADSMERRRAALAALLRIGGDSFTLAAINDTLVGCGINAVASETGHAGQLEVRFPDVPGIPDDMEVLAGIIEAIVPCHLALSYVYWYVTWAILQSKFATWRALESRGLAWSEIEKLVR